MAHTLTEPIYSLTVRGEHGTSTEFLDAPPAESLIADLTLGLDDGRISSFEILEGYLNGGDSQVLRRGSAA